MELSVHFGNGRKAEEKEEVIKDGHFGTRMMEEEKGDGELSVLIGKLRTFEQTHCFQDFHTLKIV